MTVYSSAPLDIETMRVSARRMLVSDGEGPSVEELATLILTLEGHLALIIPEVELAAAGSYEDDDMPRVCARTAVSESRRKLRAKPGPGLSAHVAYARRLSRSLNSLCDHHEHLSGVRLEAE